MGGELPVIEFNPSPGLAAVYVDLLQHRQVSLNRAINECKDYIGGQREFNECVQDSAWTFIGKNMTCIVSGITNT